MGGHRLYDGSQVFPPSRYIYTRVSVRLAVLARLAAILCAFIDLRDDCCCSCGLILVLYIPVCFQFQGFLAWSEYTG